MDLTIGHVSFSVRPLMLMHGQASRVLPEEQSSTSEPYYEGDGQSMDRSPITRLSPNEAGSAESLFGKVRQAVAILQLH